MITSPTSQKLHFGMSTRANQVCIRCRKQKRKCDKFLPICSLCKRLNRPCSYPVQNESPGNDHARPFYVPDLLDLTPSNIRLTLEGQVSAIVGDGSHLQAAAATYFRTVHTWLPVVSENLYYRGVLQVQVQAAQSDFSLLTLSMFLVCSMPVEGEIPIQTRSLYTHLKSFIAILEAIGTNSLEMLQCRLLMTVFEVGHAMYPAAYISTGANVRAAVALGANELSSEHCFRVFQDQGRAEEARRTWRGIIITDRYTSLESGKGSSPFRGSSLESVGSKGEIGGHLPAQIDPLTKLSQASRLLEQVLAHVHETTSHYEFNVAEALQLMKTMTSFLAAFQDGTPAYNAILTSAIAVCRSAMLEILEFGCHIKQPDNEYCTRTSKNMVNSLIDEIVHGATLFLSKLPATTIEYLPVFILHCIHKAAVVLIQDLRGPERAVKPSVRALTCLLRLFGMRWTAGSMFLASHH